MLCMVMAMTFVQVLMMMTIHIMEIMRMMMVIIVSVSVMGDEYVSMFMFGGFDSKSVQGG